MDNVKANADVILIGSGIMSATLGTLLKELNPQWGIKVFEKLNGPALESSDAMNNAGTGHSALCELNYTPEQKDGTIDTQKAVKINEQFQLSKQFWSTLVKEGKIEHPEDFIKTVPHLSFVEGKANVEFLKKRQETLIENPLFERMEFADDTETLKKWLPLMMEGRASETPVAATRIDTGTDINFGSLTCKLIDVLEEEGAELNYHHEVIDIKRLGKEKWQVKVKDLNTNSVSYHISRFVFIGAGGATLPLLQKTKIKESKHVGGFPVSGVFLVCNNPEVVKQHDSKVYGKAKVGAPPMSVPHLDTRYIDGKRSLLFGPFAGFSPKFLKTGSYFDLIGSVKPYNVTTMLAAGAKEMGLTKYLVQQVLLSEEERMNDLREFIPNALNNDWETIVAGQRVQVIKDTENNGKGTLQFGTEVITSEDGTIAALLGASPGASVSVDIMIDILKRCFKEEFNEWLPKLKEMIPSLGVALSENPELFKKLQKETDVALNLTENAEVKA
jgi:malate dehydrogenase (quinone)